MWLPVILRSSETGVMEFFICFSRDGVPASSISYHIIFLVVLLLLVVVESILYYI